MRSFDLHRSRYLGFVITHLQRLMVAAAMNVVRMLNWLAGEQKAQARPSLIARL